MDMSQEELEKLASHFKKLKMKPKVDSLEDFTKWMKDTVAAETEEKPHVKELKTVYTPSAMQHFPKISHFSGDAKKDVPYDVWKKEVECIVKEGHREHAIAQAIRSSLRGEALRVRSRLPASASIEEILEKMDSVYGLVEQTEVLMAKFYSAKQELDEDVATWSCRLEDLLYKAVDGGKVDMFQANSMLRTMLWQGLKPALKDITGHIYERISDFDRLRVAIRRVEDDLRQRKAEPAAKKVDGTSKGAVDVNNQGLEDLKGIVQQLALDVKSLKEFSKPQQQQYKTTRGRSFRGRGRGSPNLQQQFYQGPNQQWREENFQPRQSQQSYPQWSNQSRESYPHPVQATSPSNRMEERGAMGDNATDVEEPTCFRCGQVGHIAVGCRVRLDHLRRPLNGPRPASRGRR